MSPTRPHSAIPSAPRPTPWPWLALAAALALGACGDNADGVPAGPFDKLPLSQDLHALGLTAPVHVARDQYGVAHISAQSVGDGGFAQGYVMAHDRLPQMDILRRYGAGTLSELFGALDPGVIDTDLEMRVHRMRPLAEETWRQLQASTDPDDQEVVLLLTRFADGVNAYADDLANLKWDLDPIIEPTFDVTRFTAWTPIDSLILGRFQAFSLSWSAPYELDLTELIQKLRATYDMAPSTQAAAFARHGITADLLTVTPVGNKPTIDGFPNVTADTGTRSDAGRPGKRAVRGATTAKAGAKAPGKVAAGPKRPTVPQDLLDDARRFFGASIHDGPLGALGPHAFMRPYAGSNNWAVGPTLAGGKALLATDQHLQLPNPSIFYPTHLTIAAPAGAAAGAAPLVDVMGVTFPGIPGVILGTNGQLAWSGTVSEHDANDVYLENLTACATAASGLCVTFKGAQVAVESFDEAIRIGALGTITETRNVTYLVVPHHGPITPTVQNGHLLPRGAGPATSIRYTGYQPTFEIRAIWKLAKAQTVDAGFKALASFTFGSQNWTMIDNAGNIGWTTNAEIPLRAAAAFTFDRKTNLDGLAPFLVLPGDGSAEWEGRMDSRYVPHAINPASGYLATANADPVGATFDNNALNQPLVDGRPLYAGVTYAAGVREERISTLIEQAAKAGPLTLADMAKIQHDASSTVGAKLTPAILAALAKVADPTGAPADVATFVAGLSATDKAALATATTLLTSWSFAAPAATDPAAPAAEVHDAAATALFNTWMHYFIVRALQDEFDAAAFDVWRLDDNQLVRIVYALLTNPGDFVTSPSTGQPILCDAYAATGPDDSCTKVILQAAIEAVTYLGSAPGFGSADPTSWRWGLRHRLTIKPLFPNPQLNLPREGESAATAGGFPKAGDNFVINRADQGWSDLSFAQYADGPAQRFLAEATTGQPIKVKWQLPGGVIFDSRSPHYRDLLDKYYLPQTHFDAPFLVTDIVAAGEDRWVFR